MTPHYLAHVIYILESIERIQKYAGHEGEMSPTDDMAYDAILRRLQTLAESADKLPNDVKKQHLHINWKQISGFRNILVHNYLGDMDDAILRDIINNYLPELHQAMLKHIPNWPDIKDDYC